MNSNAALWEQMDAFALGVFSELATKADPILAAKIRASGVADFRALGPDICGAMLKDSLIEAAAAHFSGIDISSFRRAVDACFDPVWMAAWSRAKQALDDRHGAFDMAVGPDLAVVLAGIGLEVVPLDKKTMQPLGEPSSDWREVSATFGRLKTAFVGYDTTTAPFHALLTDSLNLMVAALNTEPMLSSAAALARRVGYEFEPSPALFQHAALLFPRDETDRFETVALDDPRPDRCTVMFLSGWRADGNACGAPNDGFMAIPLQVAHAILNNPAFFGWLGSTSLQPASMH